jgi:formylglycine-generating enzyme required for sulfatase activity
MKPAQDILQRTGYRLPTETQWEFACRAGSETSRCYGETKTLLRQYARFSAESSDRRAMPVGSLKPNDFGLFDMHGNALEWCPDVMDNYVVSIDNLPMLDRADTSVVTDAVFRVLRGADFYAPAEHQRSARRYRYTPQNRVSTIGIRLVRTLPPARDDDAAER